MKTDKSYDVIKADVTKVIGAAVRDRVYCSLPMHITRRISIDETTGCWICKGDPSSNGYQRVWFDGVRVMAHKLTYFLAYGVKPRKRQVDHLCENRACCNPEHLELVTPSVNCKRRHTRRKSV